MSSPSESLDPTPPSYGDDSHLQDPPESPVQSCPQCEALIDITGCDPLDVIECPGCGQRIAVDGQIDHYEAVKVAGRGGMGVVYKAYDASLDRYIALKLLKDTQSTDSNLIAQLETEAAITASINDPNVVRVYGTGRDHGRFFVAMELVENGSLDQLILLQGRIAEAQVLEVGIQVARGLRAAHQRGLIHRDIKPGNILFADAHTAKIVDFGLAIFLEQEANVQGEVWGTPYYVAPEKLDLQPEDFRSDMYSLGGTLFHALAGRPPFEADNASLVAWKHLKSKAVRLQAFAPWISNTTAHIIDRTLQKNPADRYQSYDELIQNLEYALEELHKRGDVPQQRARMVTEAADADQKVWTWVVLGMTVVILGLAGYFTFGRSHKPKAKANQVAKAQTESADVEVLAKELEALANRDPKAPAKFHESANNNSLAPAQRAWAQFFEGVAYLALNQPPEARGAFTRVDSITIQMKDEKAAKFLRECSARLRQSEVIMPVDASQLPPQYGPVALLAYGLHDWNLGKTEESVALLGEFRKAKANSASWVTGLMPLATAYLEEFAAFNMAMDRLKAGATPEQRLEISKKTFSAPLKARLDTALSR